VRVRIYSSGKQTGSSTIPSDINENAPIEERIRQARNAVFESELWHELNRESRTLQALGVHGKNDTIVYPLSPTKTVVLDQIYLDKYSPDPSGDDDTLAEAISLSLHLLQSYAHRRNFFRRTDSTGPLTSFKRVNTPYALLRSLITRANHQSTLSRAHALFGNICSILTAISYSPRPNYEVTEPPLELRPTLAPTEATVVALFEHLHAQVTLNLTESCTLNMKIRTSLYPLTTTNFNLTLEPPDCFLQETCRAPGIVDQWHKSYDYILFVTSCALASSFVSSSPNKNDRRPTITGQQTSQSPQWESTTRPHVIRLVPGYQESSPRVKSKQASFSLSPVSSPDATNEQSSLILRVSWECISDAVERLSTEGRIPEYEDMGDWKPAKGEGFYEWIISDNESKVVGRGASGENVWRPGSPIKSLQEVMQLAGEP
jgi:mediator of RNA polymerase II transcription subunit 17